MKMDSNQYLKEVSSGLRLAMIEQLKEESPDTGYIRKLIKCHETVSQEAGIPPGEDFDDSAPRAMRVRRNGGFFGDDQQDGPTKILENVMEMFKKANPVVNEASKLLGLVDNENVSDDVKKILKLKANEILKDGYGKEEACESISPPSMET